MKIITKIIILTAVVFTFAACKNNTTQNAAAAQERYRQTLAGQNTCAADSDCVKIAAGCCQCDGYAAINKKHFAALTQKKNAMCDGAMCTMQYCFNDVTVSCQNKKCVATPVKTQIQ
ncbi:hypothetical protein AAIR98_001411 [Elusimicrobium simillimum]|uniref:hypothetical protein n=1 Tax=Elusimicrobium simillimum TaxID=3143438 RepID=UPI003C6F6442